MVKNIWSIGGIDPGAKAGIVADAFVARFYGNEATSIATCITAQNDQYFYKKEDVSVDIFKDTLESQLEQRKPDIIKLSVIANKELLECLISFLERRELTGVFIVLDPVIKSTSGGLLKDKELVKLLKEKLLSYVDFICPNLEEALELTGCSNEKDAAKALMSYGVKKVLIKGGMQGTMVWDYYFDEIKHHYLWQAKVEKNYRGTGCHLASILCCLMLKEESFYDALILAKAQLFASIKRSKGSILDLGIKLTAEDMCRISLEKNFLEYPESPDIDQNKLKIYPVFPDFKTIDENSSSIETVQLRIKNRDPLKEIEKATKLCTEKNIQLFINDYWKEAMETKSYGLHIGQEDLEAADMEAIKKSNIRLGISSHDLFEACTASYYKPSYMAFGPIFGTTCKSMTFGPRGFSMLAKIRRLFPRPLVAIGGLKKQHLDELKKAGANSVAMISAITEHPNPQAELKAWKDAF